MTRQPLPIPPSGASPANATEQSDVAIWGVGVWAVTKTWGPHDSQRNSAAKSVTDGTGYWGHHSWVTDFFIRW